MNAQEEKRIEGIVKDAALGIRGVADLFRPVQVHASKDDALTLDVFLVANYGSKIPVLCWNVQKKTKELLNGSGYDKINTINIYVERVKVPHL